MRGGLPFWCAAVLAIAAVVTSCAATPERAAVPPVEAVAYKRVGGRELKLFVHRPAGWSAADHRPAILMIHGGGWVGGGVSVFEQQANHFAQRGLVCAVMEYRLLSRENFDPPLVCIQDAKSALRWLRGRARELGIDPQRIAAMGASAGGHLAAFLGMMDGADDPSDDPRISARAQAVILLNPVVHNGPGEWGYGFKRTRDQFRIYSPFHNVTATAAPAVIFQGTKDKLIPVPMIEAFAAALHAAGIRCDVHFYEGQEHSFFNVRNAGGKYFRLTLAAADEFLVSLRWLPPAPDPAPLGIGTNPPSK